MSKRFLLVAALSGMMAVILGAFGAHLLAKILNEADLKTYQTGVQYHFYHTLALLFTALISRYASQKWTNIAGWAFTIGIVLFSGSLYLLAISYAFEMESIKPILGPLTPLGGLFFIVGWLSLFISGLTYKDKSSKRSRSK